MKCLTYNRLQKLKHLSKNKTNSFNIKKYFKTDVYRDLTLACNFFHLLSKSEPEMLQEHLLNKGK